MTLSTSQDGVLNLSLSQSQYWNIELVVCLVVTPALRRQGIVIEAKMDMSVLMVLCLVTLSNVQLGQSQCDGEV